MQVRDVTGLPPAAIVSCRGSESNWLRERPPPAVVRSFAPPSLDGPRHNHSFRGSFSAGSTPIVASKYAFCSIFQALQENHLLASKFAKLGRISRNFAKMLIIFWKFSEKMQNFEKFYKIFAKFLQNFVKSGRF